MTSNSPSSSRLIIACLLVLAAPHDYPISSTQLLNAASDLAKVDNASSIRLNTLAPLTQSFVRQDEDGSITLVHMALAEYINDHRNELEAYVQA
jgi:hypothetical protein